MSRSVRLGLFAVSAAGLAALLLWGVAGPADFGHYGGPYGYLLNRAAPSERHVSNVVTRWWVGSSYKPAKISAYISATRRGVRCKPSRSGSSPIAST